MQRAVTCAVVCAAVFQLVGCGGKSDPLHTAVAAATKTSTASAWWNLSLEGADVSGTKATVVGRGAAVFVRGVGYLAINVPSGVEYMLFTPTAVYLRPVPSVVGRLPSGRDLILAPLTAAVEGSLPGLVGRVEALTPKLLLEEVADGAESVRARGTDVIDHLPLSKYVVSVSLSRARAHATGALRLAIADEEAALGSAPKSLAVTIWIDPNGRVAQIRATPPGAGIRVATYSLTSYRQINVAALALNIRIGTNLPTVLPPATEALDIRALSHPEASPLTGFGA